ncbi:MAG: carboxypeptidase regulatory-like domain-containing protein [Bacteroidales bacterium]
MRKFFLFFTIATIFLSKVPQSSFSQENVEIKKESFSEDKGVSGGEYTKNEKEALLHYDDENFSSIGLTNGGTLIGLAYFTGEIIQDYQGYGVKQVITYVNDLPAGEYEIRIYEAGEEPGELLYAEDVSEQLEEASWNTFELSSAFEIPEEGVYVGFSVAHAGGQYPAGVDEGPADINGDIASLDLGETWSHLANAGFGNWNIRIYVEPLVFDQAPEKPAGLVVTPANEGQMSATVQWTNPSNAIDGTQLTELDLVEIFVNEELVLEVSSPEIGGEESHIISMDDFDPATYNFCVIAHNSYGSGNPADYSVWIGEDVPASPANLTLSSDGGVPTLSWDEPEGGLHDAYFTGTDSYRIVRSDGLVLENNYSGAQPFTDNEIEKIGLYSYSVTPINSVGSGGVAISNPMQFGEIINEQAVGNPDSEIFGRIPYDFFYKNSLSQTMYYPNELNIEGRIEAIAYTNNFYTDFTKGTKIKVWIGETDNEDLSSGFIPASDLTLVYDNTMCIPSGMNQVIIPFNAPYFYKGGNLVVLTYRPYDDTYHYNDRWLQTETEESDSNRIIIKNSDDVELDPNNPPADPTTPSTYANTTFYFDERPVVLPKSRDYIVDDQNDLTTTVHWINATSLSISDDEGNLTPDADYTLTDNGDNTSLLTILGSYLSTKISSVEDSPLSLNITFNTGDEAEFTANPALKSIVSVNEIESIKNVIGLNFNDLSLPENAEVELNDGTFTEIPVSWNETDCDPNTPGVYVIEGELQSVDIENPSSLKAAIEVELFYYTENIVEDFNDITVLPDYWSGNYYINLSAGINESPRLTRNLWVNAQSGEWQTSVVYMGDNPKFSFYYRVVNYAGYPSTATSGNDFSISILASTDFGETYTQIDEINSSNHQPSTEYVQKLIDVEGFADKHVIIKIEAEWLSGDFYTDFDNVLIGTFYEANFNINDANNNNPVDEATITIYSDEEQTEVEATAVTNESGEATVVLRNNLTYHYSISKYGYTDYSDEITISNQNETVNVSINPIHQYQVTGRIVTNDEPAEPLSQAHVTMEGYGSYSIQTDENGEFTIDNVYESNYSFTARYIGYETHIQSINVTNSIDLGDVILIEKIVDPFALSIDVDNENQTAVLSWNNVDSWSESFEAGEFSEGWTQNITNTGSGSSGDFTWQVAETISFSESEIVPQDGDYQAFIMWDYEHQDEWLITPEFIAPEGDLVFWYYGTNGSPNGDNYYVKISEDDGQTWTVLWNASDLPSGDNHYDAPAVIDLSAYAGQTVKIAWHNVDGDGLGLWYSWAIDNITVGDEKIDIKDLNFISRAASSKVNGAARDGKFNESVDINDLKRNSEHTKQLDGFNIFLNDMETPIDFVEENVTTYEFTNLVTESNVAGVQSVYSTGLSEIMTIDFEIATGVNDNTLLDVYVYPNPFSEYLHISDDEPIRSIIITNLLGQIVMEVRSEISTTISTHHLPKGVYLVTLISKSSEKTAYRMFKY